MDSIKRRRFLLGSGVALSGTAVVGSGAFSRVESQREARVDVVGDEDAYLGLVYDETVAFDCEGMVELAVENQTKEVLGEEVTVDFDTGDGITITGIEVRGEDAEQFEADEGNTRVELQDDGAFGIGRRVTIELTVECDSGFDGTSDLTFGIEATGDGTNILVDDDHPRSVEVDCDCAPTFDASSISFVAFCAATDGQSAPQVSVEAVEFTGDDEPVTVDYERTGGGELGEILLWTGGGDAGLLVFDGSLPDDKLATTREESDVPTNQEADYIFYDSQVSDPKDQYGAGWQSDPCNREDGVDNIAGVKYEWAENDDEFVEA